MKNHATVFSAESAVMTARKFAIVRPAEKLSNPTMPDATENPLQAYVLRVMQENNLSFQKIEDNAREEGGTLGRATIQQIANGKTTNPGIFTLVELANGLKRPLEEVLKITLGDLLLDPSVFDKSYAGKVWKLADDLPPAEQKMFRRYLQIIEREILRVLGGE